ncbi:hypothetical protein E4U33_008214, partial [Claviceps sp. LM78 group G4]
ALSQSTPRAAQNLQRSRDVLRDAGGSGPHNVQEEGFPLTHDIYDLRRHSTNSAVAAFSQGRELGVDDIDGEALKALQALQALEALEALEALKALKPAARLSSPVACKFLRKEGCMVADVILSDVQGEAEA